MAQDWSVHALVYFYSAGSDLPWAVLNWRLDLEPTDMKQEEALKLALEYIETNAHERRHVRWAIKEALAQPDTVQVSPLEFVTRVTGKEEIIGEPVFWAQWPSKELNT
jgi:hypothetical protein